jgi:Polyketide cyclase / dehydrase and lipid transport
MGTLKWVAVVVVTVLAVAVLLAYLRGRSMPMEHVAQGQRDIAAPPAAVASWIREVQAQPSWRPGVSNIEVLERSADFIRYREHGSNGAITFRLREVERDRRFESVIDDTDLAFGGRWLIRIEPADGHSVVTIREEGVVRSPLFRFLSRYVFGHDTTLKRYLAALAQRAVG